MKDELTPELKKALKELPRERMPEGLEERLTAAMHDRGIIGKPRRVIALTSGRVASLVAACVALVIGAYSIGLHRGGGDQALTGMLGSENKGPVAVEKPDTPSPETVEEITVEDKAVETPPPVAEAPPTPRREAPAKGADDAFKKEQTTRDEVPPARRQTVVETDADVPPPVEEGVADREQPRETRFDGLAEAAEEAPVPPATQSAAPRAKRSVSSDRAGVRSEPSDIVTPPMVFLLGGTRLAVEAPDSVRIVEDNRGRMLLIYTSDGVIRVRVINDD